MSSERYEAQEKRARSRRARRASETDETSADHRSPDLAIQNTPAALADSRLATRGNSFLRTSLLLDAQQTLGNRAMQRMIQRTPIGAPQAVQREGTLAELVDMIGVDAPTYANRFSNVISGDLYRQMMEVDLTLDYPGASWLSGDSTKFMARFMKPINMAGWGEFWNVLSSILPRQQLEQAVNRGRDATGGLGPIGVGPDSGPEQYRPAVALELRAILTPVLKASFNRSVARYMYARNEALLAVRAAKQTSLTGQPEEEAPEPGANDITPGHPLDRWVIEALCDHMVDFDTATYQKKFPEAKKPRGLQKPRPIEFNFLVDQGVFTWLRVEEPFDASAEDVAAEIYGDSALAYTLTGKAPLFGFRPDLLAFAHKARWQEMAADPQLLFKTAAISPTAAEAGQIDPTQEALRGPLADEIAANEASGFDRSGSSKAEILDAMDNTLVNLELASADADSLQLDEQRMLPAAITRLKSRAAALRASEDPQAAKNADAQALGQRFIIENAGRGLHKAAVENGKIATLGQETPSYLTAPIYDLGRDYLGAAAAGEFIGTGQARLAEADQRSKAFPIDMMEATLTYLRSILDPLEKNKNGLHNVAHDDTTETKSREEEIRRDLVWAREELTTDPSKAAALIRYTQQRIEQMQGEAGALANMERADLLWNQLEDHLSYLGETTGKNDLYKDRIGRLIGWHAKFNQVRELYKQGKITEARSALVYMENGFHTLEGDIRSTATLFKEREKGEAYLKLGMEIVGFLAVTFFTAGIGSYVSGGLVAAGWSAGSAAWVGAGVAGSLQTAYQTLLEKDPNFLGVVMHLVENVTLYRALPAISKAYEGALGAEAMGSLGGKFLEGGTQFLAGWLVSLTDTYINKKRKGEEMTASQVYTLAQQGLAQFIGSLVVARVGKPFLEEFRDLGGEQFRATFGEIDAKRQGMLQRGQIVAATKNLPEARAVLDEDRILMLEENGVALKLGNEQRLRGASATDVAPLDQFVAQNDLTINASRRQSLMLSLNSEGARLYSCPPGQYERAAEEFHSLNDTVDFTTAGPGEARRFQVTPQNGDEPFFVRERQADTATPETTRMPEANGGAGGGPGGPAGPGAAGGGSGSGGVSHYEMLQEVYGLSDEVTDVLRRYRLKPEVAVNLLSKSAASPARMTPDDLAIWTMQLGPEGVEIVDILARSGIDVKVVAEQIVQPAKELGLLEQTLELAPRLEKPQQRLPEIFADIRRELADGKQGKLQEFIDAHDRALNQTGRNKVRLGGQADVVDPTAKEAVQHKNLKTPNPVSVGQELQKAVNQINGKHGETPLAGYTRVVDVRLRYAGEGPRNELLDAGPERIREFLLAPEGLEGRLDFAKTVRFQVRITNERGVFVFEGHDLQLVMSSETPGGGGPGEPGAIGGGDDGSSGGGGPANGGAAPPPPGGMEPPGPGGPGPIPIPSGGGRRAGGSEMFANISMEQQHAGWNFKENTTTEGEFEVLRIDVVDPSGKEGFAIRAYNKNTGELQMREIDAGKLRDNVPLPGSDQTVKPSDYLTLRAMKRFGIGYGALRTVAMREIYNVKAVLELRKLEASGMPRYEAALRTIGYVERALNLGGQRIVRVDVTGGVTKPAREMLEWNAGIRGHQPNEQIDTKRYDFYLKMLEAEGLNENSPLFYEYDVELQLAPRETGDPQPDQQP